MFGIYEIKNFSKILNNHYKKENTVLLIKINRENDITILSASVTDFADSLGYCEYKIPLSIQGVKPKPSQSLILGTKAHIAEEKYEQEHVELTYIH